MPDMKPEVFTALEELQASPPTNGSDKRAWLDQHRDKVLTVWEDKGASITEDLLGLTRGTIYSWARHRGIKIPWTPTPRQRPPEGAAPGGDEATYWRGRAEALWEVLMLLIRGKEAHE